MSSIPCSQEKRNKGNISPIAHLLRCFHFCIQQLSTNVEGMVAIQNIECHLLTVKTCVTNFKVFCVHCFELLTNFSEKQFTNSNVTALEDDRFLGQHVSHGQNQSTKTFPRNKKHTGC